MPDRGGRGRRQRTHRLLAALALTAALTAAPSGGSAASQPSGAFTPGRLDAAGHLVASTATATPAEPLVLAASPIGRQAIEPSIGVDGDGTAFMTAAAYDAVAPAGGLLVRNQLQRSTDGGATWMSVQPTIPAGVSGEGETSIAPVTLDPWVHVDTDTGRVFSLDLYNGCTVLSWSDDAGESWAHNPLACGTPANDHQTLVTAPPPPGAPTLGYPNAVYYCFNQVAQATCSVSLDGGLSFMPAGTPSYLSFDPDAGGYCTALHGAVAADGDGRLFVPKGHCGSPVLAVSEDGGRTWRQTQVDDRLAAAGHRLSVAADADGTIYFLWWDAEHRLPWMAVSVDHGRSFSEPVMVAPPGVAEVNFPTIDALGSGKVAIHFPATRVADETDKTRTWDTYIVVSEDADSSAPTFLWALANDTGDPVHRGDCQTRCGYMMDFLDVTIAPDGSVWAAAVDTCTVAWECNDGIRQGSGGAFDTARDYQGVAVHQVGGPRLN